MRCATRTALGKRIPWTTAEQPTVDPYVDCSWSHE